MATYNIVKLVNLKLVKEDGFRNYSTIGSKSCVMKFIAPFIAHEYREVAYIIGLDNRNRPSIIHQLGVGTVSSCSLPPSSVLKVLLLSNCSSGILVHNKPVTLGDFKKAWYFCLKKAGLEDFRFHDTRHYSASQLVKLNINERTIMQVAGWKTNMLSTYYGNKSLSASDTVRIALDDSTSAVFLVPPTKIAQE